MVVCLLLPVVTDSFHLLWFFSLFVFCVSLSLSCLLCVCVCVLICCVCVCVCVYVIYMYICIYMCVCVSVTKWISSIKRSRSLRQLLFKDAKNMRDSFLFKLSEHEGMLMSLHGVLLTPSAVSIMALRTGHRVELVSECSGSVQRTGLVRPCA